MVSTLQPVVLLPSQKLERVKGEKVLDLRGKSCILRATRQGMRERGRQGEYSQSAMILKWGSPELILSLALFPPLTFYWGFPFANPARSGRHREHGCCPCKPALGTEWSAEAGRRSYTLPLPHYPPPPRPSSNLSQHSLLEAPQHPVILTLTTLLYLSPPPPPHTRTLDCELLRGLPTLSYSPLYLPCLAQSLSHSSKGSINVE